jgi:hypothetical protein
VVRGWINYAGAFIPILTGLSLYSWDPDFPIIGTPTLALLLIIAGLVWAGLAVENPSRERRYRRSSAGSVRADPARGAGHRRHRGSQRVVSPPFTGRDLLRPYGARGGVAMNASAATAGGSFLQDSVRIATKEVKGNLYSIRGSMWAVLSAVVLNLTSSHLLLTDKELPHSGQSEILYVVASLAIGLGLLVAGVFAAEPVTGKKERETLVGMVPAPTKRGAALLGKVWGAIALWFLIFVISAPHILVVGFGAGIPWAELIHTLVLGTLCVASFATLTAGICALSGSRRGVMLASTAILVAMGAPTLLGNALQKSWLGNTYDALSPVAQARLSLENVIVDKETLLAQLPHLGALAAFVAFAGLFAAFAACGVSPEGGGWPERREGSAPWDMLRSRSRRNAPVRVPRSPKGG